MKKFLAILCLIFPFANNFYGQMNLQWDNSNESPNFQMGFSTLIYTQEHKLVSGNQMFDGTLFKQFVSFSLFDTTGTLIARDSIGSTLDTLDWHLVKLTQEPDGKIYALVNLWDVNPDSSIIQIFDSSLNRLATRVFSGPVRDYYVNASGDLYVLEDFNNLSDDAAFSKFDPTGVKIFQTNFDCTPTSLAGYNTSELAESILPRSSNTFFLMIRGVNGMNLIQSDDNGNQIGSSEILLNVDTDLFFDKNFFSAMRTIPVSNSSLFLGAFVEPFSYTPIGGSTPIQKVNSHIILFDSFGTVLGDTILIDSTLSICPIEFFAYPNGEIGLFTRAQSSQAWYSSVSGYDLYKFNQSGNLIWKKEMEDVRDHVPVDLSEVVSGIWPGGKILYKDGLTYFPYYSLDTVQFSGNTTSGIPACLYSQQCQMVPAIRPIIRILDDYGIVQGDYEFNDTLQGDFKGIVSSGNSIYTLSDRSGNYSYFGSSFLSKFSPSAFSSRAGRYTVGPYPDDDFSSISDAIADLNGKRMTDGVIFQIRPGIYNDTIQLDSSFGVTRDDPSFPIIFIAEDPELQNTVISGVSNLVNIDGQSNIQIVGLEFETTGAGARCMDIQNSSGLSFIGLNLNGSSVGEEGIFIKNVNNCITYGNVLRGFDNGYYVTGGSEIDFEGDSVFSIDTAIVFRGIQNYSLRESFVSGFSVTGDSISISILNSTGEGEIISSSIEGTVLIYSGSGVQRIVNCQLTGANKGNINAEGNSGVLEISDNKMTNSAGFCLDIFSHLGGKLHLANNSIIGISDGIRINSFGNTEISIIKNKINVNLRGIVINPSGTSTGSLKVFGNFSIGLIGALKISNYNGQTEIISNTLVGNSPVAVFSNLANLSLCGNLGYNSVGGSVIDFTSTTYSAQYNGWWSSGGGSVSNDETGLLVNNTIKADPIFVGPNDYHLAYNSPMQNQNVPCQDSLTATDLEGNGRVGTIDFGAFENIETPWDGEDVEFVLEDGYFFTPGTASFFEFEISGLTNYTTVQLDVKDRSGTVVYTSTSKTTFWDGSDSATGLYVDEGAYAYLLTLDGKEIGGFVYVKR